MFPFRFLAFVTARVCLAEDGRERFREAWAQLFVIGDVEARVERLIREPPVGVAGVRVGTARVGQQPERVVEERAASGVVLAVLGEATVHVREAGADAVLVALQRGEVNGVGEVRGEQLVGLGFEACPIRGQVRDLLILARVALIERGINVSGEALIGAVADRDAGVRVRDQAFRDRDGNRPAGAVRLLRGTAGADEVGVGRASRVGGEVQQHPRPTGAAVQEPFQMVGMLNMAGHLRAACVQERLHLIEQSRLDERFVRSRMQSAFVTDHARVVGVGEELVERVLPERLRWALRCRHRQQPSRGQLPQEAGDGGLAGRVVLEREPDQRGAVGIDLDRAYLAAVLVGLADVQVADRSPHRRAALRDLLRQPLRHFRRQVAAVELRDGRHDAVHEHPRRRLVDGLGSRDEGDACTDECFVDLHVVGTVAGEAVEFMHDAELHPRRGDERQHLLEPVTVGRPRGLARVHELAHDLCAQFVSLAVIGFALGGDGETLFRAAALCLLTGRDAKVGHSQ